MSAYPQLAIVVAILGHVETWLEESGCPLTDEQRATFDAARAEVASQEVEGAHSQHDSALARRIAFARKVGLS